VAAGAVLVALALSELLLRVFDLAPTQGIVTMSARQFERLPGIFAPDQVVRDRRIPQLAVVVTVDSFGYRGADFPRRKAPGEVRILTVGDSFVFGDYVADDSTFPAQLERRLRPHCPGVRVINAGLGGTTITEHAPMLERGLGLSLDYAILMFSENDVTDLLATPPAWEQLAANRAAKSRFPLSVAYPVLRRTALFNLVLRARARAAQVDHTDPTTAAAPDSEVTGLRAEYLRRFWAFRERVRSAGLPLTVVVYPSHHAVPDSSREAQLRWLARALADSAVDQVSALPALRATGRGPTELFLLPYDGHPSGRGYAVAADTVGAHLVGRLAGCAGSPERPQPRGRKRAAR